MPYTIEEQRRDITQFLFEHSDSDLQKQIIEKHLGGVPVEKRLEGVPVEKRLEGVPIEKRLEGLSAEERAELLRLLTQQPPPA